METREPTALEIPGLITGARLQRRLEHKTRHDAHRELARLLAGTSMGLRCTNGQIKAAAKTMFAMAKKRNAHA